MIEAANSFLWGKLLIGLLIGVGVWFTVASRFVQFRYFGRMFRLIGRGMHHQKGRVSSFQALAVTVAGRVGAGNIAGVAVAITLGGPGAIFWMWVIALIGMATSFFECSLAQVYKKAEPEGTFRGGPAYYMDKGAKQKWLGTVYSGLLVVSVGAALIALQSFTVASSFNESFGVSPLTTGVILAAVTGVIIFGGIKRIAEVAEWIVPFMAVGYCLIGLVVIGLNYQEVPAALALIVKGAFGLEQAVGGGLGTAILMGAQRGLFSNEAGLGHAANVAAVAHVKHPAEQGIVQSFSVFIDTMVLCTVTALIILLSGVATEGSDVGGVALTQIALSEHIGDWSGIFVTIALTLFAFTTILYLYYLGENGINFFSNENKSLFNIFRVIVIGQIIWGALQELTLIFALADLAVGLLALSNLIALSLIAKKGFKVLKDYDRQLAEGNDEPTFDYVAHSELNLDQKAWPSRTEQ
ncbi:MAG: sodium:alanine symporter family protein [Kangiellaceae bacterium]|jgi:AGCS family alanine or glycine:cation symporter|nr:sodium:alanine symporter family protein [Kangiellaceae bacterium]